MQELPYTLTPNTRLFLQMPTHQEALNVLLVALGSGDGFIKVVGEVGTGKTMLCRALLNTLDDEPCITAYLPNPYLSPEALRRNFALEIGIKNALEIPDYELVNRINLRLVNIAKTGRHTILLVDEAQAMPEETIEALRLLTNLETEFEKLFQVVLFGQPELNKRLESKSLRQLKQRITFNCELEPLNKEAVTQYLELRAHRVGFEGLNLFAPSAAKLIAQASGGVPRIINILAHKSLMVAYGRGDKRIRKDYVRAAIADTEGVIEPKLIGTRKWLLGSVVTTLLLCGAVYVAWLQELI